MKTISLFLVAVSFFYSCTTQWNSTIGRRVVIKNPVAYTIPSPSNNKIKVKDQLAAFYEKPEVFLINTQQDTTIIGRQGTKIEIHAFCLLDESNQVVDGIARIELKELYTKKDMILSNKPTMSDGRLLESNGEIYLNATMDGKSLTIGCAEGVKVTLITPVIERMEMWKGNITKNGNINWEKDSTIRAVSNDVAMDVEYLGNDGDWTTQLYLSDDLRENEMNNFMFSTSKFGWINCDRFYEDDREKVNMYVKLKNPFPKEYRTYVYALFTDINSVMQLYSEDGENYLLSNIPAGETIKLVSVSETELKTFFSLKELTVVKNQKELVELQPMEKEEIKKVLDNL